MNQKKNGNRLKEELLANVLIAAIKGLEKAIKKAKKGGDKEIGKG